MHTYEQTHYNIIILRIIYIIVLYTYYRFWVTDFTRLAAAAAGHWHHSNITTAAVILLLSYMHNVVLYRVILLQRDDVSGSVTERLWEDNLIPTVCILYANTLSKISFCLVIFLTIGYYLLNLNANRYNIYNIYYIGIYIIT